MKHSFSLILLLTSFSLLAKEHTPKATADIQSPTQKNISARLQILEDDKGIKILATAKGLKPGAVHGFHIHEVGKCDGPDFKSAGGHYNPQMHPHKGAAAEEKHMGDLGNLVANKKGEAQTEVLIPHAKKEDLDKLVGRAVLIHAKADDQSSQPSGDSGDRIACGIIKKT